MNDDNSPSNAENQEQVSEGETPRDTEPPPPPTHGWLEQFEAFSHSAFEELKKVAEQGLVEAENELLIVLSAKLMSLALQHDINAFSKLQKILET